MRDTKIDLLRFVGLLMIILAHVNPPALLFQLRDFDVPLMVLLSGMSFSISYKQNIKYVQYVWKRIKRLLFPVWIFLTFFFSAIYAVNPSNEVLNSSTIIESYFLTNGIGYVWIIRVFLLVALAAPAIFIFNNKIKNNSIYLLSLFLIFIVYVLIKNAGMRYLPSGLGKDIFTYMLLDLISYSLIFALGLRLAKFSVKTNALLTSTFLFAFIIFAAIFWVKNGHFVATQNYKYPISGYYLSYALAISVFLWMLAPSIWRFLVKFNALSTVILFMAENSIWVYLWHIFFIGIIKQPGNFMLKYLIILVCATSVTALQVWLVKKILVPKFQNQKTKSTLKTIFTG